MDSKNYTQVLIDGKIYTLGGIEEEAYLQKAASYVNDKNAQMRRLPGFTKQNADYQMVMTELNIADDYFKAMEWGEGMERQKNDMEKETYSLKHELVSTQMKLEAVLKDLEERQRQMEELSRRAMRLEKELKQMTKDGDEEAAPSQPSSGTSITDDQAAAMEQFLKPQPQTGVRDEVRSFTNSRLSDEELARRALQAARKANSHKGHK